jgi:hypothetical protein
LSGVGSVDRLLVMLVEMWKVFTWSSEMFRFSTARYHPVTWTRIQRWTCPVSISLFAWLSLKLGKVSLSENNLDAHLINIVRISSDYFTRQLVKSPVNPPGSSNSSVQGQTGFIKLMSPPSVPVGGNTTHQLLPPADMSLSQYRWTLSQWRDNLWSGRSLCTFPVSQLTTRIPITSV